MPDPATPACSPLRAVEALAGADTVVLDRVAREQLLVHARPDVEVLDGATDPDGAPLAQATRSRLAVEAAKAGRQVVRLMDGDPAIFNGLAEEAAACVKAHVPFEVVPGVSSVSAVPAYAGVPLTGAKTRAVHVVTPAETTVDWTTHAAATTTVVVWAGRAQRSTRPMR